MIDNDVKNQIDSDEITDANVKIEKPRNQLITKSIKRKIIKYVSIVSIIAILYGLYNIGKNVYAKEYTSMKTSHVFVCDNPEHKSDFDNWLHDELSLDWVPTYVIIKDGSILSKFPGDIDIEEFSTKFAMSIAYDMPLLELPNYEISNIDGERKSIRELFSNGTYVLEVHWIDCEDCQHQDETYTDSIYEKYHTAMIYRYYIKSDKEKVQEKYN